MNTHIHGCCLTVFTDLCLYFFLCLLHHLFDSSRMDTSIYDQFLKCHTGNLTTDWIKCRQYNCFRCIVNNKIYTCESFQRTDITAFTTDDPSLHLITWKLYHRNSSLRYMIHCTLLNGIDHIFFGFLSCFFLGSAFQFSVKSGYIHFYIIFNGSE